MREQNESEYKDDSSYLTERLNAPPGGSEKRDFFSWAMQQALSTSLDSAEIIGLFDRLARSTWHYERADFLWLDQQNLVLRPVVPQDPAFPLIFLADSLAEHAAKTRSPFSLALEGDDLPAEAKWLFGQGFRSAVAWPLFHDGKFCAMALFSYRGAVPLGPDSETMKELANLLASALTNARLYTLARKQLEMTALLNRAGVAIALGEADLHTVLLKTLEEVRAFIGSHNIRLYRLDEKTQILHPEVVVCAPGRYTPEEETIFASMTLPLGRGITGWVAATGNAVISGDAERDPRGVHVPGTDYIDESMICMPLKARESILGALTMAKIGLFEFGEPEVMLASTLAAQIAIALENTRLYQAQLEARKQLERDIERIRHLEAVREDFLYSISHELKTPLASIAAALEIVDQSAPEYRAELLLNYRDLLLRSSERLQRLVGNLLETSKVTSGSVELYRQWEDLADLARETIRRLQPEARLKELEINLKVVDPVQAIQVDRERILQVMQNLLSNAIKYSSQGGSIMVRVSMEKNGMVQFSIQDEGVGIPQEDLQHVFDRFFRADTGQAMNASGTGLGLFLSKALVEAHEGQIGLDSELGKGTRIWFTIPTGNAAHR